MNCPNCKENWAEEEKSFNPERGTLYVIEVHNSSPPAAYKEMEVVPYYCDFCHITFYCEKEGFRKG